MANTKIHLTFDDGIEQEYTVNDEAEARIKNGSYFHITAQHPIFGDVACVSIGMEMIGDTLMENRTLTAEEMIEKFGEA